MLKSCKYAVQHHISLVASSLASRSWHRYVGGTTI